MPSCMEHTLACAQQYVAEATRHRSLVENYYKYIIYTLARKLGQAKSIDKLAEILGEIRDNAKRMIKELKEYARLWSIAHELAPHNVAPLDESIVSGYVRGVDNVVQSAIARAYEILHGTRLTGKSYEDYLVYVEPGYREILEYAKRGYRFPDLARLMSGLIPGKNLPKVIKIVYRDLLPLLELYKAAERGDVSWLLTNISKLRSVMLKNRSDFPFALRVLDEIAKAPQLEARRKAAQFLEYVRRLKDAEKAARAILKVPDLHNVWRVLGGGCYGDLRQCLLDRIRKLIDIITMHGAISVEEAYKNIDALKELYKRELGGNWAPPLYNEIKKLIGEFYQELKNHPDVSALRILEKIGAGSYTVPEIMKMYYRAKILSAKNPRELVKKLESERVIPRDWAEALLKHPSVLGKVYEDIRRNIGSIIINGTSMLKNVLRNNYIGLLVRLTKLRSPRDVDYKLITEFGEYALPKWFNRNGSLRAWLMEIWYRLKMQTPEKEKYFLDKIRRIVYKYRNNLPEMMRKLREVYEEWQREAERHKAVAYY